MQIKECAISDEYSLIVDTGIGEGWWFLGSKKRFGVIEVYCSNPDCLCRSVNLYFEEMDKDNDAIPEGIQFSFSLNLDNWSAEKFMPEEKITQEIEYIVNNFIKGLTLNLKERFQINYEIAKNPDKKAENFHLNDEEIDSGLCVGYNDIFGDKYAFSRPFIYNYKGEEYCVYDQYCINPKCHCNECVLDFYCESTPEIIKKEYFTIRFHLDNKKKYKIEEARCSHREAGDIFESWLEDNPSIIGVLKNHYEEVKETGKRLKEKNILEEEEELVKEVSAEVHNTTVRKIGRNEPCPCGSGKKYKKCCGQ